MKALKREQFWNRPDMLDKEMYYNWNRLSMLGVIAKKTKLEIAEEKMRIDIQNAYSNGDDNHKEYIKNYIRETFTPKMIKSVDVYMNK